MPPAACWLARRAGRLLLGMTFSLLGTLPAWASCTPGTAIGLVKTADLGFGAFVAGTGGTVAVSGAGTRTKTGGVLLVPQGAGAAGTFMVSGDTACTYAVTLPPDDTVVLSDGSHSMALNKFISTPAGTGTLAGGSQTLAVGATLSVSNAQAPGAYAGAFSVTVQYN